MKFKGPARSRQPPAPVRVPAMAQDEEQSTASESEDEINDETSFSFNNDWTIGSATYDPVRNMADPLYQINRFLAAFNETLSKALVTEKYLCIDESINQWLGSGKPNLKKVPRKPHPIGQEFKTLADNHTYCILQLDTVSDKAPKEFDDVDRNLVATVKRLCKPWFTSGRTIIADCWFGSPEMTTKLLDQGLFSIMQVNKRAYWPRGMPSTDIIQCLCPERNSFAAMSKVDDSGRTIFVCLYRDKKAKALISSCSTTTPSTQFYQDSNGSVLRRPQIFQDYETQKSSVDANNNRRDNMVSIHDAMKKYRWEVLATKFGQMMVKRILHAKLKSRLAMSLLHKLKDAEILSGEQYGAAIVTRNKRNIERAHQYIPISRTGVPK
ncbi:hypothetical protein INT47_006434 [Mucor saturninus]|uniref:PiggyBac transposable element-derived protein domain-containing protein n=1 Tax=Mucor saturninus TaxID=64648 RepID=A0A8H7UWD8_9FUNG|nr:hypothetical protein INT47_006434 [Mucor saturninus]